MKRLAYAKLKQWKNKQNRNPLVVKGARAKEYETGA